MVCTKCGHDNPLSAKFCNECGTLVDRRKGERRQADRRRASARAAAAPAPSRTAAVETAEAFLRRDRPLRPQPMTLDDTRERLAPAARPEVSGPSFLGLTASAPGSGDYLLEDEPRSHWRAWAVLLLLVLLGVLAYMQWKTNWRGQPLSPPPAQSAPQGSAAPASEATGIPAATPQEAAKPPDPAPQPPAKDAAAAATAEKPKSEEGSSPPAAGDKNDGAEDDPPDKSEEATPSKPAHKPGSRKPAADKSEAADPHQDPMVLMAQRYLYGQGVRRDCDQAMVYLRAANQKASAAARSQMGVLYATGYCVPLDRVRAYQWFTSALNVEPGNPALQRERNNLWSQMSSDERQQAVK